MLEDTTTPSELITLSYAYESYFSLILDNINGEVKIPNMGVLYRNALYSLNKEFLDNKMVFGSSVLGVSIQIHLNIVVMQAMKALSNYMYSIMYSKHASSLEQQAKYLEDAKEYLDKYKDLCKYVENYSMTQTMDKSMEEAIDELKDRKSEEDDLSAAKENMNEAADKLDEKDDEKRKGEELNNEEVNQAVEDKSDEVREKIENEKEEEEVKEEQEELDNDSKEIKPEDTKDELIPGTNINKPRDRGVYESDEEYVDFLKDYYEKVFGPEEAKANVEEAKATAEVVKINPEDMKDELIPGTDIHRPRDRGVYESDEEYVNFLKGYYDKTFGPEVVAKSLEPKAEVQTTSTVPTVTEIVPTAEHDQELSMMINDLGNMPKEVPTKTNGTELDSMFKGNAVMNPNGTTTTISPAVMTK